MTAQANYLMSSTDFRQVFAFFNPIFAFNAATFVTGTRNIATIFALIPHAMTIAGTLHSYPLLSRVFSTCTHNTYTVWTAIDPAVLTNDLIMLNAAFRAVNPAPGATLSVANLQTIFTSATLSAQFRNMAVGAFATTMPPSSLYGIYNWQ